MSRLDTELPHDEAWVNPDEPASDFISPSGEEAAKADFESSKTGEPITNV